MVWPADKMAEQREFQHEATSENFAAAAQPQPAATQDNNNIHYVDGPRIDELKPFVVRPACQEIFEDWVMDFEHTLRAKDVEPKRWLRAFRAKVIGVRAELLELPTGQEATYEAYRDAVLDKYGSPDPWTTMIERVMMYNPVGKLATEVVEEVRRLHLLWERVAERVLKKAPQEVAFAKTFVIPKAILALYKKGIDTKIETVLGWLLSRPTPPTVDEMESALVRHVGMMHFPLKNKPVVQNAVLETPKADPQVEVLNFMSTTCLTGQSTPLMAAVAPAQRAPQQQFAGARTKKNLKKKKVNREPRPPCQYCGKNNHTSPDCWSEFPEKRPKKKVASTPAAAPDASMVASIGMVVDEESSKPTFR